MAYDIEWSLWEVDLTAKALQSWEKGRVRAHAERLVARAKAKTPLTGQITGMLGQELRDWVLRGGERFLPLPDLILDSYWRARRALPGFYDPLALGLKAKKYLGIGGSGEIGEGVALAVVETLPPWGLGHLAICRPLGSAPDFICVEPADIRVRPLIEVKATENPGSLEKGLHEGVHTLLDIYRAWQRYRPLGLSPATAASVWLGPGTFKVELVRLVFRGKELVQARDDEELDLESLRAARRAMWAADHEAAARALDAVLAGQPNEFVEQELRPLREVRKATTAASVGQDKRFLANLPRGKKTKKLRHDRREALTERLAGAELPHAAGFVEAAESLANDLGDLLDEDLGERQTYKLDQDFLNWRILVQPRADGLELRAFRPGRVERSSDELEFLDSVLEPVARQGRVRRGHGAVSVWARGAEWTAFRDGRLQGWLPEVDRLDEGGTMLLEMATEILGRWGGR